MDLNLLQVNAEEQFDRTTQITAREQLAKSIVAVTEADKDLLANRVLTSIETAMSIDLPDYEACGRLLSGTQVECLSARLQNMRSVA